MTVAAAVHDFARAVTLGLSAMPKRLPAWLLYDAAGSELFERITELPEYYLTRTERGILAEHADTIVQLAAAGSPRSLHVVELGAGSASKTELLLAAAVRMQGPTLYVPIDVSEDALAAARARLELALPRLAVRPIVGRHEDAFPSIRALGPRRLVLFLGSSVGNYPDRDAAALLRGVRRSLAPGGALLLGADLRKSPEVLLRAYDDSAGVTAAFNRNILTRINRELGASFDLDSFRHVAIWNEAESQIEMHLESVVAQTVAIESLGLRVCFAAGERIHTESSIKYDQLRLDRVLETAGFTRERTWLDRDRRFAVLLARV